MAQRRARSAERGRGAVQGDALGRLTDVLERLWQEPRPRAAEPFRTPTYSGHGDVEYFIRQFTEVAEANGWAEAAQRLHMREALREEARDCGQAATVGEICIALRARFGVTEREARSRLANLKRDYHVTLQEHSTNVERLVNLAYPALPADHRATMALDFFCSTLGNGYLQRHLLAVATPTLADAVRAGNEYLQIKTSQEKGGSTSIKNVDGSDDVLSVAAVTEDKASSLMQAVMQNQAQTCQALQQILEQLSKPRASGRYRKGGQAKCWGCGQAGHIRRNCTASSHAQGQASSAPGNAGGPQQ